MHATRRTTILSLGAFGASAMLPARAQPAPLPYTPTLEVGPYYPVKKPKDQNADLTRVQGRKGRAAGQIILLAGRVLTPDGSPVRNATLEIWQADTNGRYGHPVEPEEGPPPDPSFQGYSRQKTDGEGRFSFVTVKPGAYRARGVLSGNAPYLRAPHIHFDITAKYERRITQMYFRGDDPALFEQDVTFKKDLGVGVTPGRDPMTAPVFGVLTDNAPHLEPGAKLCSWDIVLRKG